MAGFSYRGQINGKDNPIEELLIIGNSQVVKVGDAVSMSSGFIIPATSSTRIYGICIGLANSKNIDLENAHVVKTGTYTNSTQSYTAASDNQTVDKICAVVIPDSNSLWYNVTSGSLTTAMLKLFFPLTSVNQINQGSSSATVGQFQLWKLNPDEDGDATKGLFKLAAPQTLSFTPS
jgi:hypothetical protein